MADTPEPWLEDVALEVCRVYGHWYSTHGKPCWQMDLHRQQARAAVAAYEEWRAENG